MAIEKMTMVNVVGPMEVLEQVAKYVVLSKSLHPVNAMDEINTIDFTISTTEDNLDALVDLNYVRPYVHQRDYSIIDKKLKKLLTMIEIDKVTEVNEEELIMHYEELEKKVDEVTLKFEELYKKLSENKNKKEKLEQYVQNISYFKGIDVPLEDINNLKNFYARIYKISIENSAKLKNNYENIQSIVKVLYKDKDYEIIIAFVPALLEKENDRVFRSLNCMELNLPKEYKGTADNILKILQEELKDLNKEIYNINKAIEEVYKKNNNDIGVIKTSFELQTKTSSLKDKTASTNEFFYLCGWVPKSMLNNFKNKLEYFGDEIIIIEKETNQIENENIIPPTKLKNNALVKPFETMVGMYGIPSYIESDPTSFLAISYMVMFGAMFGDLGQGLVFLLAGLYLKYKLDKKNIGGILSRIGISSSIFGLAYGSIFGFEDVIKPLIIRPMENIRQILLSAIVFGCGLLIIGFIYSLINNFKRKDLENGVFGKDGIIGLTFYILLLVFAFKKAKNINTMSTKVWMILFIALLLAMVFKQPLSNLILNKRPLYTDSKSDYFVEGGFGVIETLLSMFSNTVSFIRVGAFALNHVGLFIAFASIAQMMKSSFGSILMYIIGNVVIIGLEGLIVFIQGLRLEYYELFSKYYDGAGIKFEPIKLNE
ncbi:V-type ATP synthase subunit I [Clostridium rectalis]|uniref:V-type ATP synthase subunit I n=1 Tax=Clostridium rectalis TaxID=2040295 RepID=UPI0013DE0661|nr:V-type ATPase 116kDa subunit family protein [Clostridium rectalis]